MRRFIVADIYGRTSALATIAATLPGDWKIIEPYDALTPRCSAGFHSEHDAYKIFTHHVGIERYAQKIKTQLSRQTEPCTVLGFSVGASAIWHLSTDKTLRHIAGALCFYGAQIRHHPDISPRFPVQLILPSVESHFSVTALASALAKTENVYIHRAKYLHGFMNACSVNFSQDGYTAYLAMLNDIPLSASLHTAKFNGL